MRSATRRGVVAVAWICACVVCLTLVDQVCGEYVEVQTSPRAYDEMAQEEMEHAGSSHEARVEDNAAFHEVPMFEVGSQLAELLPPAFTKETNWEAVWAALHDAVLGTIECARLWGQFLLLIAVPMARALAVVAQAIAPPLVLAVQHTVTVVMELDPKYQAALVVGIVLTVVCYHQGYIGKARRKYVQVRDESYRRYRAFLRTLGQKTRAAMLVLPHVLFFVGAYVLLKWTPPIVFEAWNSESLVAFFAMGLPLVRSLRTIYKRRMQRALLQNSQQNGASSTASSSQSSASSATTVARTRARRPTPITAARAALTDWRPYEACLQYWVLWSTVMCALSVISLFIPAVVAKWLALPPVLLNVFLAWVHAPFTRGDIVLYRLWSPVMSPYANRVADVTDRTGRGTDANQEQANIVMRMLVAMGILKQQQVHILKDIWSQGPAAAGLMFLFTPGFVCMRGAMLFGFGFPAYITMGTLAEKRTRKYESWLIYFVVAVVTDHLLTILGEQHFWWLPLFQHFKLLVLLYLQFPYFRGAETFFDAAFHSIFVHARVDTKED